MIFSKKLGLRLSSGCIADIGDFYAIGQNIFNKAMQGLATATAHNAIQCYHPCIKGAVEELPSTTSIGNCTGKHLGIYTSKLTTYFDSTMGSTSGKRFYSTYNVSQVGEPVVLEILADGSTSTPFKTPAGTMYPNSSGCYGKCYIFAENANVFFIVHFQGGVETQSDNAGSTCIYTVDKATKSVTVLLAASAASGSVSSGWQYNTIYEGIFNGCAVFTFSIKVWNATSSNYQEFGYFTINISTAAITKKTFGSNTGVYAGMGSQIRGFHSKLLVSPWDNTQQCTYYIGSKGTGGVVGDTLSIYKIPYPVNIQPSDTLTNANVVKMTVAGSPPDFVYGFTSFDQLYLVDTFAFTYNGIAYLVGIRHYRAYSAGTSGYPVGKIWLFQISTDGTTATWLQTTDLDRDYSNFLPTYDGLTFLAARYSDGIRAYRFDPGSLRIVASEVYSRPNLVSYGVDEQNTVFLRYYDPTSTSNYGLELVNLNNSAAVVVTFENNPLSLAYTGTPLAQNVVLNAYDMFGTRVVRDVVLYLEGCTFTSGGGGTAQTFTTSATEDTVIGLTISAAGQVNVTPEFA